MIIDGKAIAANIEQQCKNTIAAYNLTPKLVVITTDAADSASKVYMRNKKRAAERIGILYEEIVFLKNATQTDMIAAIRRLNLDPQVHGIIVQLPLPAQFNPAEIQRAISPEKDVDGFHPSSCFHPCTPEGVMRLVESDLSGRHAVVIGRSEIVGKPLARLLLQANATVSQCHSKTPKDLLKTLCRNADYIFCAAGVPNLITPDFITPSTTLIDISINRREDGKLCGDVHPDCYPICAAYTPVPGGVGPMTVAILMQHTVDSAMSN